MQALGPDHREHLTASCSTGTPTFNLERDLCYLALLKTSLSMTGGAVDNAMLMMSLDPGQKSTEARGAQDLRSDTRLPGLRDCS